MEHRTTNRIRNRRGEGGQLRDDLLAAAREILTEKGSEAALSVRGVTKRAGVVPQSFYLRFSGLDELLLELYRDGHSQLFGAVSAAVAASSDAASERLRALVEGYLRFARQQPATYRLMMGTAGLLHPDWVVDELPGVPLLELLGGILASAETTPRPDAVTTALVAGQLHGLASLLADRPSFPWPAERQLIDGLVRLYFQ